MAVADNQVRFRCTGRDYVVTFDANLLMGDVLEELEEHLGGESVMVWAQRFDNAGVRVRDLRTRDIIALVFLARAQADPGVTWAEVAKSCAPLTFALLDDEAPPPANGYAAAPAPLTVPAAG